MPPVAVITGASSGIGAATAVKLAEAGYRVILAARRAGRISELAGRIRENGGEADPVLLDVTDRAAVDGFAERLDRCDVLVNNAGGALGVSKVQDADEEQWRWMYDANVLGVMRVTRALLPKLVASGDGHIITIGSIAAFEPYPGGAGYNAAKFATRAVMGVLRQELLGQPVRVTEIDPGMVDTEFSTVRFGGDKEQADAVYAGLTPLVADDIADCIAWAATRPSHVNIDQIVVKPRDQASATKAHRSST
jgi:NADP-dependent 3-hydroxy acid dehydrogenase YdfG